MFFNQYNRIRFLVAMVVSLVAGIVCTGLGISQRSGLRNAKQISDLGLDVKDGDYVKGITDLVGGYYCYETRTQNGKKTETYRWYMVGYESKDANGYPVEYFIGVKVPSDEFATYQKMSDSKGAEYELTFQGKVKMLLGDQLRYRDEFVREVQREQNLDYQLKDYTPDFYIELQTTKQGTVILTVGLVLLGLGIICLVATFLSSRKSDPYASTSAESSRASYGSGPNGGGYGGGYGGNTYNPYGGSTSTGSTNSFASTDTYNSTPRAPYMPFADENGFAAPPRSAGVPKDELDLLLEQEDQKVSKFNANIRRNNDQNNGNDLH